MTGISQKSRDGDPLEKFSGIIMETLRELNTRREPISLSSLTIALGRRADIVSLLRTASFDPKSALTTEGGGPSDQESPFNGKLKILQKQKEELLKQLTHLEEKNLQAQAFCRKSLLTLANLTLSSENCCYSPVLERFKKLLVDRGEMSELDHCLSELKDLVLRGREDGRLSKPHDTGIMGKWLKKSRTAQEADIKEIAEHKRLQNSLLSIIAEFHLDLGKDYLERFSNLQQRIRETTALHQLLDLSEEVTALVQDYLGLLNQERSQVTDFISEIGKSLIEMEANFMTSFNHASEAHRSNVDFSHLLEGQMEEIKKSTHMGKTLAEIRGFVASRITSIKAALETKRKEDQKRMEEMDTEMGALQQNLQNMKKEIEQVQEQSRNLEKETLLDPLTGIPNRRAYDLRIREEMQRYHRYQQSFSLLLFDVDHFKGVNDTYGHWAGDKCLKEIIKRIKPAMRECDFLARYGGEEFVVILPGTDRENSQAVGERLRQMIEKTHFLCKGQKIPLTISVGVTSIQPSDRDEAGLFNRVDAAMYEAKRSGRNKVVLV
ncbi:MAG: diguanylate cyclase [Deltaproteobacteria bacterium]|nr:diguanylate cyclase [Deltaproteobacteria bacterium]